MTPTRSAELDGLRSFAVSAVLLAHFFGGTFPGGAVGVDLFFVLSGYLITTLLFREGDREGAIDLRAFWQRRALRLLPVLLVFLVAASIGEAILGESPRVIVTSSLATLLYVANITRLTGTTFSPALAHTWSLSLEEQFYVVWPLVIAFAWRRRTRPNVVLAWLGAAIALIGAWRWVLWANGASYDRLRIAPDTRADMILIGCLLALLVAWDKLPAFVGERRFQVPANSARSVCWP